MAVPTSLRPTAVLLGSYAALLGTLTFLLAPVWHEWDWAVFQAVSNLRAPAYSPKVEVVDLADYDPGAPARDRRTIAQFLDGLLKSGQRPAAVVLDLYFESICSTTDSRACAADPATAALTHSLDRAASASPPIRVYATENPVGAQGGAGIDAAFLRALDRDHVYDHLRAGHTVLQLAAADGIFYRRCYRIAQNDDRGNQTGWQDVWALPYRVVKDVADERLAPCTDVRANETTDVVRVGPHPDFQRSVHPVTLVHPMPAHADLSGKYVIVATLAGDLGPLHERDVARTNPELLAWALSDRLEAKDGDVAYYQPLPANEMLAALVAGFATLTLVAFVAVFQGLRRLRLQRLRRYLPWIASAAAVAFALALFAGFEGFLFLTKSIQPQVSLVVAAVVLAGVLCGERGREILLEQSRAVDIAPEESNDYDVFISYAHDELDWVYEHVYVPLKSARTPSGRELSIFFDTSSIRIGAAWQDKIALSIDGSKFVVPVYSERYFERAYCRFEIKRAHRKWIAEGPASRCVLPIMRGNPTILQTVDDIQAFRVDDHPAIVDEVIAVVLARVEPASPPTPAPVESS